MQTKEARQTPPRSEGERAADECRRRYRDAVSWRRRVKRELSPLRLTLTQWLVLQTTAELFEETRDAVSELAVAARSGVDRMTMSQVMWKLAHRGLVDIGPDAVWPGLRIVLTRSGQRMASEGASRVEAASLAWLEERSRQAA